MIAHTEIEVMDHGSNWLTVAFIPVSPCIIDAIMYLDCEIKVQAISPN